ncbi:MAG: pilin [Candidatus Paceibacterota bacterium]
MKSNRRSLKIKIVLTSFFTLLVIFSFSFYQPKSANAAVGDCPNASLSFESTNYNAGDTIRLNGSNSTGTWSLCIYDPSGERVTLTMDSTNNTLSTKANISGKWTGVIQVGGVCSMDLSSANNCQANTQVGNTTATEDEEGIAIDTDTEGSISFVNPIETDDFTDLVGNVLKWLLSISGVIALLMIIYGGMMYIASTGDQQKAEQGKKIVTWTIVGLIVILLSYSIITVIEDIFIN